MQTSKGQITIFVIIGAVVLLGVGLTIFLNQDIQEEKPAVDVPDVSLEARPVTELVSQCLEKTSEEALRKVGMQGGYVKSKGAAHPPYRGEAVEYTPYTIPYWRHLTGENCPNPSGCDATEQPKLCDSLSRTCDYRAKARTTSESIERKLERFVLDNLDRCVDDFSSIDMYDIERDGEANVNVRFAEGSTEFVLDYPIVIRSLSQQGNKKKVERFRTEFDVDFVNMYKLADEIIQYEREHNIYEIKTMDLVEIYAGLESKLPPTTEVRFRTSNYGPWVQTEVKQLLKGEVLPYMTLMSLMNSANPKVIEESDEGPYSRYKQGIYRGFVFATSQNEYDFDVYHRYTFSPIHLMIDNGAELIQGKDMMSFDSSDEGSPSSDMLKVLRRIGGFALKDYRFDYDISYPLVIKIEDPDAMNGDGFTFQMATEVNIRNNEVGYGNFTSVTVPTEFESNLDDPEFRPEQNVTVKVYDKHTDEPLEGAMVRYVCGDEYDIGVTRLNEDGKAVLKGRFPYCEYGGFVAVDKIDYMGTSVNYNNRLDGSDEIMRIGLWPKKEKTAFLKARSRKNISELGNNPQDFWLNYQGAAHPLTENQVGYLTINRKKESPYDTRVPMVGFGQFVGRNSSAFSNANRTFNKLSDRLKEHYDKTKGELTEDQKEQALKNLEKSKQDRMSMTDDDLKEMENNTFRLVPGNYSVDISLLYKGGINISSYNASDEEEYPSVDLSTWLHGSNNFTFTLTEEDVYSNSTITFFTLEMPLPVAWDREQLEEKCDDGDGSQKHCRLLDKLDKGRVTLMTDTPKPQEYQESVTASDDMIKPFINNTDS